ncbi:STAS domain-containing protein [Actinoplanes rectilineatus]|uniref:STAS domain-containing protein n=1 Tax=Actinoplanes rectilineatus TaxID=113571 RepID=UPI0005F28AB1|nr:STAS domain-containing protein [Actinoplanes rectilineatus]
MNAALTFATSRRPSGDILLSAVGEIDMSNAATLAAALADAHRDASGGPVTLDLTGVEYIDSAGLAVLYPHVATLRLVATDLLAPVLTVAGLDDLTTIAD